MLAKEVMSDGVMSIRSDATVLEAAKLLVNMHVSAMPVLDEGGAMIGIVSEADLVGLSAAGVVAQTAGILRELADETRAAAAYEFARTCKVTQVMSRNVVTIDENASLLEVAETMREHRIKRVPVLRGRTVVGILSRVDLLKALISYAAASSTPAAAPAPAATRPGPADEPADDQLRREVLAAVTGKDWSRARRTDVVVRGTTVHLWGVAPNQAVRSLYEAAVRQVRGVTDVVNHMHVATVSSGSRF
jgi:CBS domain-containing protein